MKKERLLELLGYVRASKRPGNYYDIPLTAEDRMSLLCDIIERIIEVQNDRKGAADV